MLGEDAPFSKALKKSFEAFTVSGAKGGIRHSSLFQPRRRGCLKTHDNRPRRRTRSPSRKSIFIFSKKF